MASLTQRMSVVSYDSCLHPYICQRFSSGFLAEGDQDQPERIRRQAQRRISPHIQGRNVPFQSLELTLCVISFGGSRHSKQGVKRDVKILRKAGGLDQLGLQPSRM